MALKFSLHKLKHSKAQIKIDSTLAKGSSHWHGCPVTLGLLSLPRTVTPSLATVHFTDAAYRVFLGQTSFLGKKKKKMLPMSQFK